MPRLLTLLLAAALTVAGYHPPVDGPVVDPFRLPDGPYGAGNRGLDYATAPGTPVRAIGDGLVVFAGTVAGTRYVTVLHPDGLRSSYGGLTAITTEVGRHVAGGDVLGTAGEQLHLGVRAGGTYLDPATLFAAGGVHLVPLDGSAPGMAAGAVAGTLARRS